jgi:hypothetical protein
MTGRSGKEKNAMVYGYLFPGGRVKEYLIIQSHKNSTLISPIRAPFANRTIPFFGSIGNASTPVENIAKIWYFEKIPDLTRNKPVYLAFIHGLVFFRQGRGGARLLDDHEGLFTGEVQ